jgi:nitrate reductase NapAB chaperone NapD
MPIAGAVVVPTKKELERELSERLDALAGASVEGVGSKGIALVLEAESVDLLERLSREISEWEEVLEFQVAYLNWEDALPPAPHGEE